MPIDPGGTFQKKLAKFRMMSFSDTSFELEEAERLHVQEVIDAIGEDLSAVAKALGIGKTTLYRKINQWTKGKP